MVWIISFVQPPRPLLNTRDCCCIHGASTRAKTHTEWAPRPILVPRIVPLCLVLLLSKECQAPATALARVENQVVAPSQYMPITAQERDTHNSFSSRVDQAISWLEKGKLAQAQGDFSQALLWYTQIIEEDGDLALSEYARVGRAISLYEVGDKEEAFVEMEDASLSLKGYPGNLIHIRGNGGCFPVIERVSRDSCSFGGGALRRQK